MFVTSISGSNKSERCETSNRNIANFGRILNQEVAIFEDPKRPKNQELTSKVVAGKNGPYVYQIASLVTTMCTRYQAMSRPCVPDTKPGTGCTSLL